LRVLTPACTRLRLFEARLQTSQRKDKESRTPTLSVHCYKGVNSSDIGVYNFDPQMNLADVRTALTSSGFVAADTDDVALRFVASQSKSTNLEDALIAKSVENIVPLQGVLGANNQLILTNIVARKKPDLIGIQTTAFFHRYLSVSIRLNMGDGAATNNAISAFPPYLLTNVKPTSKLVTGIYDNVCVVVEKSIVAFDIRSWGAVGFQQYIAPDAGQAIVNDELFCCYGNSPNQFMTTTIDRYASVKNTIQILGTDTAGIDSGQSLRYQKVTFRTRRMTAYDQDGYHFESNAQPPALVAPRAMKLHNQMVALEQNFDVQRALMKSGDMGTLPGDGIKPGAPVQGPPSGHDWGAPIYNPVTDDPSQAMGEVVVYFFVFKSLDDAKIVFDGYNAPDPSLWS
jgi:hypothetical protein